MISVIKQLQKALYEAMLEGEIDYHLGYKKHGESDGDNSRNGYSENTLKTQQGPITINIPRDRNGYFEPTAVAKDQRRAAVIDDTVIGIYAKVVSLSQIRQQIEEVYAIDLSEEQLSSITEAVAEDVLKWQARPLDQIYPIIYLDGIYVSSAQWQND